MSEAAAGYRLADWLVEPHRNRIVRGDEERHLEPRSMDVLVYLLDRPGDVVSVDELIREIWAGRVVEESAVHQAISKIRRALGDDSQHPVYLESIPRRGYRLVATVTAAAQRESRFSGLLLAGAVLIVVITAVLLSRFERIVEPPALSDVSVAVLPLDNLSGDAAQDYLADGTTELLITELGKHSSLRVISRLSVIGYADSNRPTQQIAKDLGVASVVTGAISRSADRIVLSVSLMDAATGRILWSERFDDSEVNMPGVHQAIARAIAERLLPARAGEVRRVIAADVIAPAAYDDYLRAVQLASASTADTVASWGPEVIERLERVIAADGDLVDAWALLADVHAQLDAVSGIPGTGARRAAERALALNANSSAAHAAMGYVRLNEWDFAGASASFSRAVELGPNNARALIGYARYLLDVEGRVDEALELSARVPLLDPFNPYLARERAELLWAGRRFERALEESRSIRERFPQVFTDVEWVVYLALGRYEAGREVVRALLSQTCPEPCDWAVEADSAGWAEESYTGSWRAWKAGAAQRPDGHRRSLAIVAAWLGETDEALDWLEEAYEHREPLLYTVRMRHLFDPLRDDPRYQHLLARLNFPSLDEDAGILAGRGKVLSYMGRSEAALAALNGAIERSPDDDRLPFWLYSAALAHFAAGRDAQALGVADRALAANPGTYTAQNIRLLQAASHSQLGNVAAAAAALDEVLDAWPALTPELLPLPPLTAGSLRERYADGLRRAGLADPGA